MSGMSSSVAARLPVVFVSIWCEGDVRTRAWLDLRTGEVLDIELSDAGDGYEHLVGECIESTDGAVKAAVSRQDKTEGYRVSSPQALAALAAWFTERQMNVSR